MLVQVHYNTEPITSGKASFMQGNAVEMPNRNNRMQQNNAGRGGGGLIEGFPLEGLRMRNVW